jgi:hypothetical protein
VSKVGRRRNPIFIRSRPTVFRGQLRRPIIESLIVQRHSDRRPERWRQNEEQTQKQNKKKLLHGEFPHLECGDLSPLSPI